MFLKADLREMDEREARSAAAAAEAAEATQAARSAAEQTRCELSKKRKRESDVIVVSDDEPDQH